MSLMFAKNISSSVLLLFSSVFEQMNQRSGVTMAVSDQIYLGRKIGGDVIMLHIHAVIF